MRLEQLTEVKYYLTQGDPRKAIEFLKSTIEEEKQFLEDEDEEDYNYDVVDTLNDIISLIKKGKIRTHEDLEKVSSMIYDATAGEGMYGDTDYSDEIRRTLGELLKIE